LLAIALNCPRLKVMELVRSTQIDTDTAKSISQHWFKNLHTLMLTETFIVPAALSVLLKQLASIKRLQIKVRASKIVTEEDKEDLWKLKKIARANAGVVRLKML